MPEPNDRERAFELSLGPSFPEAMERAGALLASDLDAWVPDLSVETRSAILLALHEALANILEHGLAGADGLCEATWRMRGELLSAEFVYSGPDYEWSQVPDSPLASFAESGYGMVILDAAMDSLVVSQGLHGKKRLVLCRRLGDEDKGGGRT